MESIKEIALKEISVSKFNPRKHFDDKKMEDLTASIKEKGIIVPVIVRKAKEGYELVCGERRYRASEKAGLKCIPALIKELTDQQALECQVIENLQREDINSIEEAQGFNALLTQFKYTQEKLANEIGKSQGYIASRLALLDLREDFQEDLISGALAPGHVKYLMVCAKSEKVLDGIRKRLKETKEQPTVRDFEVLVNDAIAHGTKDLVKSSYGGGPEFDTKDCKTCEFNRSVRRWPGQEKRCFNPECYKTKQAAALKNKNERIRAKIDKGQVVPDDDLKGVEDLSGHRCNFDKKTCKKCEKRKAVITKDSYSNKKVTKEVCTDKECFARKNQEAVAAEEQKQKEEFKKTVAKVKEKATKAKMDRDFWALFIINQMNHGYTNKKDALIEAYGLEPEKLKTKKSMLDYFTRNNELDLEQIVRFITYWED